ncbi:MAG: aminomethyl-transferring glycine dehydrogenase subunit GcvPB [Candidatus Acetothermia bacterium]|jgi:glycine dehydrogenase subunit 2|nr:aminomethyl-transferring glycine dehydrogenase subunit GcvPB [Candidatus Acetothermia bacterium]MDH7505119.1 aminomethyl-transferring glycine dehydrogenase subunit GcvPB [Candidatus Acetothermia bacterium]
MSTIFELSKPGRRGVSLPRLDLPERPLEELIPKRLLRREPPGLPEVSQPDLVRHYTRLSKLNYGVDDGLYPLGSCTMKYNPKVNEDLARLPQFKFAHPLQGEELSQGILRLMFELGELLKGIAGLPGITLQPAAGAHGELVGMLLIKKYFEERGERRTKILLPDSAHGTNPASAHTAGFQVIETPSDERGMVDLAGLKRNMTEEVAGIMLTVPNTLGIFEEAILEVAEVIHKAGGLCYFDGANLNSIVGRARPGDMGMDIVHFNLHKTFSTPHGGGGPGSGPVAVTEELEPYLPVPVVARKGERYYLDYDRPKSIGGIHSFYGHFAVMVRAYAYILMLGDEGLRAVSGSAVLAANYLKERLKRTYKLPYDRLCKHEFVLSGKGLGNDVRTLDIAKRLIDYGFHPPTIYFPLIVEEALMIEPTETVSKEELDRFIAALEEIAKEAKEHPQLLKEAPHNAPVRRLDEVRAARQPILRAELRPVRR